MSKELDLYSVNLQLWRFLGVIDAKSYTKLICLSILPTITNIFQFCYVYKTRNDFAALILGSFLALMRFDCLMRLYTIVRYKDEFNRLLMEVELFYQEAMRNKAVKTLKLMELATQRLRKFSIFTISYGAFGLMITVLIAIVSERRLPIDIFIPGIDVFKSPLFEIIFGIQIIFVVPFLGFIYSPFTNIFVAWVVFGISLLKDLSLKIENLRGEDNKEMLRKLKQCMKYHKRIINYIKMFEDLVSVISFLEFVIYSIILIALLACCMLSRVLVVRVAAVIYILGILIAILSQYWHTNEFAEESLKVANAVYSIDWISGDRELRACVAFMIHRCQQSLKIKSGGVLPMTLGTLQVLIKTSMSYFACLQSVMDKKN